VGTYLIRRLFETVVAFFLITTLIFILLHLNPAGPCSGTNAFANY